VNLLRIRWAVRAVLALAVGASIAGNVLHAQPNTIARIISAWSPTALLLTIELISRVPVHSRWLAAIRRMATAVIAGIAAYVSYQHMAAVASRYGESDASAALLPLSVDGLVVVASVCLVELGGRIRAAQTAPASEDYGTSEVDPFTIALAAQAALAVALEPVDELSVAAPSASGPEISPARRRRPAPTVASKVARIAGRNPDATPAQIAAKAGISESTARRHLAAIVTPEPSRPGAMNGREPVLAASSDGPTS
jgi:hypothetical protein